MVQSTLKCKFFELCGNSFLFLITFFRTFMEAYFFHAGGKYNLQNDSGKKQYLWEIIYKDLILYTIFLCRDVELDYYCNCNYNPLSPESSCYWADG